MLLIFFTKDPYLYWRGCIESYPDHQATRFVCGVAGFCPYQTVVLWQFSAETMTAVRMVSRFNVGNLNMIQSKRACQFRPLFPLFLRRYSAGRRRWSWMGSGWFLSQFVCTRNQLVSESSYRPWTFSLSRSMTAPSLSLIPDRTKQTGAPIFSVLSLCKAPAQVVSSSAIFLTSQQVGMSFFTRTLMKSSSNLAQYLVLTSMENAPGLWAVRVKTLPTMESDEYMNFPPRQYSILAARLASSYHMLKSRFLPWMILPQSFLTMTPEQALIVEYSYMKLMKKILSKGQPESLAMASTSATKSLYLNQFLANQSMPSKKVLVKGMRSKQNMNFFSGYAQSLMMGAHRTSGGSSRLTLQVLGAWVTMGSRWGCGFAEREIRETASSRTSFIYW